eukprot:6204054-Pleurochrysis_carterae.AAC.1
MRRPARTLSEPCVAPSPVRPDARSQSLARTSYCPTWCIPKSPPRLPLAASPNLGIPRSRPQYARR